jgi:hypothetical protein
VSGGGEGRLTGSWVEGVNEAPFSLGLLNGTGPSPLQEKTGS